MADLKNPMRFSIKDREIDIDNWLHHPDFTDKQVDKIVVRDDQLYLHWSEMSQ